MEGEFGSFIKVWTSVFVCIFYCYSIGKIVPKGTTRLVCALPVVCLFFYLPLNFSSIHLGGGTGFFISWLGSFKLLLFAFGKGPLASDPSISIARFLAIACLPIEIQENPSPKNTIQGHNLPLNHVIKGFLLAILIGVLNYSQQIHPKLILVLHCLYIYLLLETQLIIVAALAWGLLGLDLKPHFNEPYLSTSLQNFWGRRWNLVVTSILRQSVYEPTLNFSTCVIGRRWASLPAVFATFLVSGLMHELIYYHMGRVRPTWEVTWFFVLHGFCLMVEIVLKKALKGRCRLPRLISVV
ncbi:acyl-CoA--sterol O-acyltransferase 1-like [Prunus yedoensis var. nudiflora]|uniref:Acyl-CoA--sterol O-acyltransferase 1-like n=1 Tax=Prunus yedoensis var. nudiflora TaxID=2094558 RepID=A0A314ZRX8_PRUYE|nr:acyl-CoA--sterol O-acyltransferase 1-like [Prunus yedoensis var. nudiflora]